MQFRYARHTNNIHQLTEFYTGIIGLNILGHFENHEQYDGIFLGQKQENWHLEFTTSPQKTTSTFDEDDILVFYFDSEEEILQIKNRIHQNNIAIEKSKNPYWNKNGLQISDPDGYKVVITLKKN